MRSLYHSGQIHQMPSATPPSQTATGSGNPFRHRLAGAAALLLATSCVLAVFWPFLAGNRTFLFRDIGSDSANASYPFYCQSAFYLRQYGFPAWSTHQGLGQAFSGLVFGDPFTWPVILQDGPAAIARAIGVMEAVKCLLAILIFGAFLRCAGAGRLARLLGALAYGLSGYLILGSCWNVFSTEAVYLALLLLATERFLHRGSVWLIPVPSCLLGMLQPFYYWGFGLFTLAYLLLRRAERCAVERPPPPPKKGTTLAWAGVVAEGRLPVVFGVICAIGVLASGVFLLSSLNLMLQSPRVGGEASYARTLLAQSVLQPAGSLELLTALYRTFSTDMLGVGSGFTGWQNYLEAPVFYCGLFMLLLIPQWFVLCEKRVRGFYGGVLALALVPVFFPWLRHAFWLFQGDYYRLLSLFITTTLILLGIRALTRLEAGGRLNLALLAGTVGLVMVCLLIPPAERFVSYTLPGRDLTIFVPPAAARNMLLLNQPVRNVAIALLVGDALLLAAWSWLNGQTQATAKRTSPTRQRNATLSTLAKGALAAMVIGELIWLARVTLNDRPVVTKTALHQKTGYNDYTLDALDALRANDPAPFYRVNKDYSSGPAIHGSLNDAMVQNFYGTACYTQFNQLHYIRFLNAMGVLDANNEHETRWCPGLTQRPLLQIWAGTKYCLTKAPAPYRAATGAYEEAGTWGDVTAFRYRQWLPLGFTYDHVIAPELFTALAPAARDALLFQAAVVESADQPALTALASYNPLTDATPFDLSACVARRRQNVLTLEMFQPDRLRGHLVLERDQLLFFSLPFDHGWQATVDGQPARLLKVNIGFMGLMLSPGRHVVELRYRPPLLVPGLVLSGCGLAAYLFLLVWCRRRDLRF